MAAMIMCGRYTSPSSHRADLPPDFDRLMARLINKTRSQRYPDAATIAINLAPMFEVTHGL